MHILIEKLITKQELEWLTKALEHVFGISCQVIADFNFYEFYKIQKCVIRKFIGLQICAGLQYDFLHRS